MSAKSFGSDDPAQAELIIVAARLISLADEIAAEKAAAV